VRGNVFLPRLNLHSQGIFFKGDGGHTDILIEENIIATRMLRAISVSSGSGIVVRRNTVIGLPGRRGTIAAVTVPAGSVVEENIWSGKQPGRQGSNLVAQGEDPAAPFHYAALFRNALRAPAPGLADLVPVPGGPAEELGAQRRLQTLLAE
jgi:hypothetical protein